MCVKVQGRACNTRQSRRKVQWDPASHGQPVAALASFSIGERLVTRIAACTKGLKWKHALSLLDGLLGRLFNREGLSLADALSLFLEAESKCQMNIILCNSTISWSSAADGDHLERFDQHWRTCISCDCRKMSLLQLMHVAKGVSGNLPL